MSWMSIYWVIPYFVGQNDNFHLRFGTKLQDGKMTLERWQYHYFIFTQRLWGLLVKSIDFNNSCCIICQWWPFKMGKSTFFLFQSLNACNSKSITCILISFWMLVFTIPFFWYLHFLRPHMVLIPEIQGFQCGSISKLLERQTNSDESQNIKCHRCIFTFGTKLEGENYFKSECL